jgi:hypothetical protein
VPSDFPQVTYWKKKAWTTYKDKQKNLTKLGATSGQQGSTRAAKGKNVMMQYIQEADGTLITGTLAADIQDHAHSIWQGLHKQKAALEKWGDATKDICEQYHQEMESIYYVLCLCENHWKSQAIATAFYLQWYLHFVKKCGTSVKEEDKTEGEPAAKRLRIADITPSPTKSTTPCNAVGTSKPISPIDPL